MSEQAWHRRVMERGACLAYMPRVKTIYVPWGKPRNDNSALCVFTVYCILQPFEWILSWNHTKYTKSFVFSIHLMPSFCCYRLMGCRALGKGGVLWHKNVWPLTSVKQLPTSIAPLWGCNATPATLVGLRWPLIWRSFCVHIKIKRKRVGRRSKDMFWKGHKSDLLPFYVMQKNVYLVVYCLTVASLSFKLLLRRPGFLSGCGIWVNVLNKKATIKHKEQSGHPVDIL